MAFVAYKGVASKGERYDRSALVTDVESKLYKRTERGDFIYSSNNLETGSIGLNNHGNACISPVYSIFKATGLADSDFIGRSFVRKDFINKMIKWRQGVIYGQWKIHEDDFLRIETSTPSLTEQKLIGGMFAVLDNLITLHQRKHIYDLKRLKMLKTSLEEQLFCEYFKRWVHIYKEGAIRDVTMRKYKLTQSWLEKLAPQLLLKDLDRTNYQKLINDYAACHERQTTMDFHHQLKGAIIDAVDEGFIPRDPTRKAIIKGIPARPKKQKYLNQFELHNLLVQLTLGEKPSWDWLILIIAKTGIRFSEALGLTPEDFDLPRQSISINKTWDYKNSGGFVPTKNQSSVRKVQLDWQLTMQLSNLLKNLPTDEPIFVKGKVYNSTVNGILARHCKSAGVPIITIHGLRHTHASILLFAGVSIASVSRRLGHASMTTTQETYLHIIQELENQDVDLVMRSLTALM